MAMIRSTPTREERAQLRGWIPLAALGAGWIISGLLASWLLSGAERTRRVEAEVAQRTRELAEANRAKSAFLANMSHEVRTPMTAILGFADALAERGGSELERVDIVDTIRRNGRHLLAIVDDVLDISKIESGRLEVERVPCSLVGLVQETATLLRARAQQKGISLEVDWRFPLPALVRSDPVRVRQILTNLVGNSVKFTDSGGVRIVVSASALDTRAPRVHVEVADDGIGIAGDALARLFEPFVQADSSTTRRFGGTGLGLAICSRVVELLGGSIEVESEPGRGSTFRVALPATPIAISPRARVARPESTERASRGLVGHVLLAEDGPDNQVLFRRVLERAGLRVELVADGRSACAAALSAWRDGEPFDVILMDMQMPELDGYSATAELRRAGYPGAIVALTAHAMSGDRERCLAAGCDGYLTKPIQRDLLLDTVARHLAKARAQV
jgi:signal transduction histidine kinase/ActR/RegA family two-component response regulator